MLDKKQFDLEMKQVRESQADELAAYLDDFNKLVASIADMPIRTKLPETAVKKVLSMDIPAKGRDPKEVGDELVNDILAATLNFRHPRFLSYVCTSISPYSMAGAFLTDLYNPNLAGQSFSPAAGLVEEKLISWMGSLAGYDPAKCGGIFTSGGSLSNLTGMIAAREAKLNERCDLGIGAAFCSDQAHSSVVKGMRMMGLRKDQIHVIPSDDDFRLPVDALEEEIKKSIADGQRPFLIVGCLASTNTGSIDPLPELADLAEKYDMWLHVDGAYGGSILLSDIYRNLARGIERADSFSWDQHKWAQQIYSCSALIARDKQTLITAFNEHPEYLETARSAEHTDGWDLGIEMSRPARFLKFWYTLQAVGTDKLADIIDYSFYNSKIAEQELRKLPGWEIVSKPMCGALNFRYTPAEVPAEKWNELNLAISDALLEDGYAYVVTTTLKGKCVLRVITINGSTTTEDVIGTIKKLDEIAKDVAKRFM